MAEHSKLMILCAMPMEARAVEKALGRGKFDVRVIGMGAKRLPIIPSGTRVIVAGLAGGLDPNLRVGDVVLDCTEATGLQSGGLVNADFSCRFGRIHTATGAACTRAQKSELFAATGALAVDMEQSVVRSKFPKANIIGVRAISDPASMSVDPAVLTFVNETGRIRPLKVVSTLARRPRLVAHLRVLNSNSKLALRQLGRAVAAIVARLDSAP